MSNTVNEYSSQKIYSTQNQQQKTPNLKTLIYNVNQRINKLEHTYTNPKDNYEIGQITSEVMTKISDAKDAIIKTNGLSSKFFKVNSEQVMKKLEEIQGILDSSPAGQLHAVQQILNHIEFGKDVKRMEESLRQGEKLLTTKMEFPEVLTQMKSELLSYIHENDFDLVGPSLSINDEYEFNNFIPYKSYSYSTLRRAISQYCHHVNQGKLDQISPLEFENLQGVLGETQENLNKTLSKTNIQAASELNQNLLATNKKFKEDINKSMTPDMIFLRENHQHKFINKTALISGKDGFYVTDNGLSIVLDSNNQMKINDTAASRHSGKLLNAAKKFVKILRLVSQNPDPEPRQLLALKATRQEFLLASKAETKKEVLIRLEAAEFASNLTAAMLSPEGYQFLNKEHTFADKLVEALTDYAKTGIQQLIPKDMNNTFRLEVGQFPEKFKDDLSKICDFLKSRT